MSTSKKRPLAELIPLLAKGLAPSAAIASGLLAPLAMGASGDLDPAFGDVGRVGPIIDFDGPAWSLQATNDDEIILAGGDFDVCSGYYCYYGEDYEATNFVSRLSETGSFDLSFDAAPLARTQVLDVVLQPDGKVVAVGRRVGSRSPTSQLIIFRLEREGPLDSTFGAQGIVELSIADHGLHHVATSVVLDPDGRIVVAGSRENELIVVRLSADGSFDDSFGVSGVFVGPENFFLDVGAHVLRTADGGYRVTTRNSNGCQVIALTGDGALDNGFGTSGIATVTATQGPSNSCSSMLAQPDGRLLVAGSAVGQGFATRLLADGQPDPSFAANAVSDAVEDATALALDEVGSIVVAGAGVNGASIMRLQANGELDVLFGNAGLTLIDLPSEFGTSPVVHDMTMRADGGVVAAGGDYFSNRPFVIRLLGAGGDEVPGVLGVTQQSVIPSTEGSQEVVVNVRRTGGDSGSVSVAYETVAGGGNTATAGEDYVEVEGRLTWDDGDTTEQEIRVPILIDDSPEEFEFFRVMLSDAQGGAGLGTRNATVEIRADGGPSGQFAIEPSTATVSESQSVQVNVYRNFYFTGPVSVTLTPIGGTATAGDDFAADPVTVSWTDGDAGSRFVEFAIQNDAAQEGNESFTVELSNPTGGAIIGPRSSATITIVANDQPVPPPRSSRGGGGSLGYLWLLMLGVARLLRSSCASGRFVNQV
jgi:uncharacterized delta-60 repeat protein